MFELNSLLQQPPMRLIDSVKILEEKYAICEAVITQDHLFYEPEINGVNNWIGVEMMAQTAAIYSHHVSKHSKARIGYLTSVRKYQASVPHFSFGSQLIIKANNIYLEDSVAVFDCEILLNNNIIATARLSAYQPEEEIP